MSIHVFSAARIWNGMKCFVASATYQLAKGYFVLIKTANNNINNISVRIPIGDCNQQIYKMLWRTSEGTIC